MIILIFHIDFSFFAVPFSPRVIDFVVVGLAIASRARCNAVDRFLRVLSIYIQQFVQDYNDIFIVVFHESMTSTRRFVLLFPSVINIHHGY